MKIPILFLMFNRKDDSIEAFKAIQKYRPTQLFLAADGPRKHKKRERERCEQTRQAILEMVDWQCDVKLLFRAENLGCAKGVNGAIDWFFETVEYGIIIEDDVVVGEDFFKFCEELLPRYKDNDQVMEISAMNFENRRNDNVSYVYSQCFHCWGWASWRRAWKRMDMSMSYFKKITVSYLISRLGVIRGMMMYRYFKDGYKNIDSFNSWATRWFLSILYYDGLVICPSKNLVKNIGITEGAHYNEQDSTRVEAKLKIGKLEWPLKYNDSFEIDSKQKKIDSKFFLRQKLEGFQKIINNIFR